MSTLQQRQDKSSAALGLEKLLVLAVVATMVIVGAVFVVSRVGGSAASIRACLTSPSECAGSGSNGLAGR